MDRYEIVVPRSNGEAVFWPCGQKSAFGAQINMLHRTGNNNCRQSGIMLDVHQEDYQDREGFNTITMITLLEHVQNPSELLRVVARNLAPGGVLIAHVPNAMAVNRKIAKIMGSLADEYELSPFNINIAGHRRSYNLDLLRKDFEAAGLKIKKMGGVFYKMLSTPQINRLLESGPWEEGGFGWGRVGAEKEKDWRQAFCDACYEYGKQRPEDCNIIYAVGTMT